MTERQDAHPAALQQADESAASPGGARRVIAAVDGSPHSAAALAWADSDARLRGVELAVITVCGRGAPRSPAGGASATTVAAQERACRDMQARRLATLPADPAARRSARVVRGDPVTELTAAARGGDVLVSGTRGNSPLRSLLVGSVAQGCAERAACPVVIVPAATRPEIAACGPVVVGVDAGAVVRGVLRFGTEEAALRGARLVAVHVVYPDYVREQAPPAPGEPGDRDLLGPLDSIWAQLDALVRAEPAIAALPVEPVVVSGDPGRVLLGWTDSAALAVVASRRAGRLHDALLGSVSSQLLQHGRCPVAVVPALSF